MKTLDVDRTKSTGGRGLDSRVPLPVGAQEVGEVNATAWWPGGRVPSRDVEGYVRGGQSGCDRERSDRGAESRRQWRW
jgi:hypothetical protein